MGSMGLWGVLWELARAVVPHAAPHVARAVADAAKERRAAGETTRTLTVPQPSNQDLAAALSDLAHRFLDAEERVIAAEQKVSLLEERIADQWTAARKWLIALLVWNGAVTLALILLIVLLARR
jgi:hypothetical protein